MNILCIDIGGTYSRFGAFTISKNIPVQSGKIFTIQTRNAEVNSFVSLIKYYETRRPATYFPISEYDLVVLAVAGPVPQNRCTISCNGWIVDTNMLVGAGQVLLVNDFVAQAYGLICPKIKSELLVLHMEGAANRHGNIAVIGAGTGLGHCCLVPFQEKDCASFYVPSEAGHSTFSFIGNTEKELEQFILEKENIDYCTNDHIVSGPGLALIHEFLTGNSLKPMMIKEEDIYRDAIKLFSKLYGRACRNYCLSTFTTQAMFITGGVAKHIPSTVSSREFYAEFTNVVRYGDILKKINIFLNPGLETGLIGGAYFGFLSLLEAKK